MTQAQFSGEMFSYATRIKEIHYSTTDMHIHTITDELFGLVMDFEDEVSEIILSDKSNLTAPIEVGRSDIDLCQLLHELLVVGEEVCRSYPTTRNTVDGFDGKVRGYIYKVDRIVGVCM